MLNSLSELLLFEILDPLEIVYLFVSILGPLHILFASRPIFIEAKRFLKLAARP